MLQDYGKICKLEIPLQESKEGEWIYHIEETPQSLDSFMQLTSNYKTDVIIRMDKDCIIDDIVYWLDQVYNIDITPAMSFDMEKTVSSLCTLLYKASWRGMLFVPVAYLGLSYARVRKSPISGTKQYNGSLILSQINAETTISQIEKDKIPKHQWKDIECAKTIVITNKDIYDPGTAFVFGLTEMNGDACLVSTYNLENSHLRLLKIVTHEFAHSLGIEHCTNHKCVIGGIISLEELDSHPLIPCFEDLAKIAFACGRTLKEQLKVTQHAIEHLKLTDVVAEDYNRLLAANIYII